MGGNLDIGLAPQLAFGSRAMSIGWRDATSSFALRCPSCFRKKGRSLMKFETVRPALIVGAAAALLLMGACKKTDAGDANAAAANASAAAADANSSAVDASAQANSAVNAAADAQNSAANAAP